MSAPPLHFLEIEKRKATELIIQHHYLHCKCPISFCWGIKVEGKILGVLVVGKPCSWSATCGVVGEKYADMNNPAARANDVYELNRLWVHDFLPRNTESQFIAWCLKQLKRLHPNIILISYADGKFGHVGYVYQATNWIYAGTSVAFTDKRAWAKNPDAVRITRSPKHRYVWFSNPADQILLAWPILPYPKRAAWNSLTPKKETNNPSKASTNTLPRRMTLLTLPRQD
jgi:hypothetical protein